MSGSSKKSQENLRKSVVITNTGVGIRKLEKEILKTQISELREVLKDYKNKDKLPRNPSQNNNQ